MRRIRSRSATWSGVGRAALLLHLLSGASVVGLEILPALAQAARQVVAAFPRA
ncbi:MAG: hypothetical protein AB1730_11270 [Myxococcota bacterium]|jgi:hypothetical protein